MATDPFPLDFQTLHRIYESRYHPVLTGEMKSLRCPKRKYEATQNVDTDLSFWIPEYCNTHVSSGPNPHPNRIDVALCNYTRE